MEFHSRGGQGVARILMVAMHTVDHRVSDPWRLGIRRILNGRQMQVTVPLLMPIVALSWVEVRRETATVTVVGMQACVQ